MNLLLIVLIDYAVISILLVEKILMDYLLYNLVDAIKDI